MRAGEKLIDEIPQVEDTKGGDGGKGHLFITNLRLIWFAQDNNKINLSVGYDCILNSEIKEATSAIKGNSMALFLRTRFQQSRYEFIFSSVVANAPRMFQSFQSIIRSYETSKVYRDLKLRCAIVQDKRLTLLGSEEVFTTYNGVWNLSAEQGSLGTFIITNIRLVWFAQLSENFNASIPWVQVKCIKVRDSKYGFALVIETSDFSGGYILGFRADNLEAIFQEVS